MLDKATILNTISEAYETRARGDKAALAKYWAPDATFRLVAQSLPPNVPAGSVDAQESVEALIDLFKFEKLERIDTVVEGSTAAIHWRVTLSTASGGTQPTELCDLWKFNPDGKVKSLLQFADTALLHRMVGEG